MVSSGWKLGKEEKLLDDGGRRLVEMEVVAGRVREILVRGYGCGYY